MPVHPNLGALVLSHPFPAGWCAGLNAAPVRSPPPPGSDHITHLFESLWLLQLVGQRPTACPETEDTPGSPVALPSQARPDTHRCAHMSSQDSASRHLEEFTFSRLTSQQKRPACAPAYLPLQLSWDHCLISPVPFLCFSCSLYSYKCISLLYSFFSIKGSISCTGAALSPALRSRLSMGVHSSTLRDPQWLM